MVTRNDDLIVSVFLEDIFYLLEKLLFVIYVAIVLITMWFVILVEPPLGINDHPSESLGKSDFNRAGTSAVGKKNVAPIQVFLHVPLLALNEFISFAFAFFPVVISRKEDNSSLKIFEDIHLSVDGLLVSSASRVLLFVKP